MSDFSDRLKNLRDSKGWTKTYVANHLGIKMQTYANYEYGLREPDLETVNKLAKLFNVSTDYLLNGKQTKADRVHNMSVEEALGTIMSFEGKPVTDHDKKTMKDLLESYLRNRGE